MVEGVAAGVLAHVQLAQQHRSCPLQVGDNRRVLVRDKVAVDGRAVGGQDALRIELVLHRHWDAVHRPGVPSGGNVFLRLPRLG